MALQLEPGVVLSETYRLVEIIGKGGMGEVWRARHERLPKEVAVKVLNASTLEQDTNLERFRREAEIASRMGHPNIVEVLDWNTLEGGTPYMVMELLAGESLRDRLRRGPLPLGTLIPLLRQVGSALAEAHRHGVVHRDLKPENIFLVVEPGPDGPVERAKVLDFGISKIQGSETALTQESEVLGTPVYMAPEQAAGRLGRVSGATDQFALGAIAYEALSGAIAFSGHSLIEVLAHILEDDPPPLEERAAGLPEHVYTAVRRALSKRPEARFETVTAFVDALAGGRTASALQSALTATGYSGPAGGEAAISVAAPLPGSETGRPGQEVVTGDPVSRSGALGETEGAFAKTMASESVVPGAGRQASSDGITGTEGTLALSAASEKETPHPSQWRPAGAVAAGAWRSSTSTAGPAGPGTTALRGQALGESRRRPVPWLWVGGTVVAVAAAVTLTVILTRPDNPGTAPNQTASEGERIARDPMDPHRKAGAPEESGTSDGGAGFQGRSVRDADVRQGRPIAREVGGTAPGDAGMADSGDLARPGAMEPRQVPERRVAPPPEPRPSDPRPTGSPEALSPAVEERLKAARQAISRGAYSDALHHARGSLAQQRTQQGFLLMTQAHCGLKDLRNALGTYGNLTSGALRQEAVRFCRARDVHLVVK